MRLINILHRQRRYRHTESGCSLHNRRSLNAAVAAADASMFEPSLTGGYAIAPEPMRFARGLFDLAAD